MKILAADIGGTHARFAIVQPEHLKDFDKLSVTRISTQNHDTQSIDDLFDRYQQTLAAPLQAEALHAIALAVPGPVYGKVCKPPNILWEIDASKLQQQTRVFMLNDFAAQGYACLLPGVIKQAQTLRSGLAQQGTRTGVIGAGTGLGHCTIIDNQHQKIILPSEAGHTSASFISAEEKQLESFVKQRLQVPYVVNDHLINGRGIVLIHEFLSAEVLTAEQIFAASEKHQATINFFATLYARVCRNYCLTNCLDHQLIISGGLAAKNPALLESETFEQEFNKLTTEAYRPLLDNISILLNQRDDIGLLGAAQFAFDQLKAANAAS